MNSPLRRRTRVGQAAKITAVSFNPLRELTDWRAECGRTALLREGELTTLPYPPWRLLGAPDSGPEVLCIGFIPGHM